MEWRQQQEVSRCPSPRRSVRIPRNHFRQVPLKSLATTTLLMLAQQNVLEAGGGLAYAAEVSEKQAIEQQVEVQERAEAEEGLQEQLMLEQRLREAQALEQKLRVQLRARSKDAEADGLEDNDYAINSIEEFVDADQLEEAGRAVNRPAEEVSQKHTTVPVSHNQAPKAKGSALKPQSLSLKRLNPSQLNKKQSNKSGQIGKKMSMAQKQSNSKSPVAGKQSGSHRKEPIKSGKQNKVAPKKQAGAKIAGHSGPQSVAQTAVAALSKAHTAQAKKSATSPTRTMSQQATSGRATGASDKSSSAHKQPAITTKPAKTAPVNPQGEHSEKADPEMNELDAKRRAIQATLAALKAQKEHGSAAVAPKKAGQDEGAKEQAKAAAGKKKEMPAQQPLGQADPDAQAATQLSADALEYSMQALEASSLSNEAATDQQSAAMQEVEVVVPKMPAAPAKEPIANKPDMAQQTQQAHAQNDGEKKKQSGKKESHVAQKQPQKKENEGKHQQPKKDVGHHVGEKTGAQHGGHSPVKGAEAVATSQTHKTSKDAAVKLKAPEQHEHEKKKPATPRSTAASADSHLSQAEKKYSEAHKAQQVAKQFREKADQLKKEKIAMQAKAADLGSQHDALKKQQEQKEELGKLKQQEQVRKEKEEKKVAKDKKQPNPMDLIALAVKHQKEMGQQTKLDDEAIAEAAPVGKEKKEALDELMAPKPPAEQQEMLDANDILSGLGQDHLHEVLKVQDIKPEKNMVRIEEAATDASVKPASKEKKEEHPAKKPVMTAANTKKEQKQQVKEDKPKSAGHAAAPAHHAAPVHAAAPAHPAPAGKKGAAKPKQASVNKGKEDKKDVNKFQVLSQIGTLKNQYKSDMMPPDASLDAALPQQPQASAPAPARQDAAASSQAELIKKLTAQAILHQTPDASASASAPTQSKDASSSPQPPKTSATDMPLAQGTDPLSALMQGQTAAADQSQQATAADVNNGMADLMGQQDVMGNLLGEHGEKKETKQNAEAQKLKQPKREAKKASTESHQAVVSEKPQIGEPAAPDNGKKDSVVQSILAKMKKESAPKKGPEAQEAGAPQPREEAAGQMLTQKTEKAADLPAKPLLKAQDGQSQESLEDLLQKFAQSDESHPDDQALTQKIIQKVKAQDREQEKAKQLEQIEMTISQAKEQVVEQLAPLAKDKPTDQVSEAEKEKQLADSSAKIEKAAPQHPVQKQKAVEKEASKPKQSAGKADGAEVAKPAAGKQTAQTLPSVGGKALGDYGEDEFKGMDKMSGTFPPKAEFDEPFDVNKLEEEMKQAALKDIKTDIKSSTKKAAKESKSATSQVGQSTSTPGKKSDAQKSLAAAPKNLTAVKKAEPAAAPVKTETPKNASHNPFSKAQSIVQVSQDAYMSDFGPFETTTKADLKKQHLVDPKKPVTAKAAKPARKLTPKLAAKPVNKQVKSTAVAPGAKKQSKPAEKPASKTAAKPILNKPPQNQKPAALSNQAHKSAPAAKNHTAAAPKRKDTPAQSVAAKESKHAVADRQKAQPAKSTKKIKQQSLLEHQNQLEQQLDEKIRKKLEEEEASEDDEKRVSEEIKQVMAQSQDEDKKDDKKDKKDDKKKDKKDDKKEDKKEEKKKDPPPPPPKKETFDDPIIAESDYYYGDDPYHVRRVPPSARRGRNRRAPQQRHSRFIDEDILESLSGDQLMHRMLQDLHIHDEHSSRRAIEYLEQHVQKDNLALKDLLKKYEELSSTQTKIKKTQESITAEREKIRKLLEQLIAKMDKDRTSREKKAEKKLRQLEKEDAERRKQEENEMMEQERLARAIVEEEHQKLAKSDEIEERQMELRRKDKRVQDTLRAVKSEAARVRRDMSITELHTKEAHRIAQDWQEKQADKIGKDKDSLLEKYLKGRNEHEEQLRQLESTMKRRNGRLSQANHLSQTQEPKRHADEFDSPSDGAEIDLYGRGSNYRDDAFRLPRRRPRPYPRVRGSHRAVDEFYDPHLDEDTIPEAVGSPDLLHKVDELKHIIGRSRFSDPCSEYSEYDVYDPLECHNYYKSRSLRRPLPRLPPQPRSSSWPRRDYGSDYLPPPFKTSKKEGKDLPPTEGGQDGGDHYDYGPYGPVTNDMPKRLSKKIEYMKRLRKNSPFSDQAVEEEKNRQRASISDAYPPQDVEYVAEKTEHGSGSDTLGKLNELMKQVKTLTTEQPHQADTKQSQTSAQPQPQAAQNQTQPAAANKI